MVNSFINNQVHPLIVGSVGEAGIMATASIPNENLSVILQIIVALTTLLKLWIDYSKSNKTKKENDDNTEV